MADAVPNPAKTEFRLSDRVLRLDDLKRELQDPTCGGYVAFEGWVRNANQGRTVLRLEYEAFAPLALREGERILSHARERFGVQHACCVHRVGLLQPGDLAVWVGVSAIHRGEAFDACRYIIDEIKHHLPIWKKEHYESGDSEWVNCERCAATADSRSYLAAAPDHVFIAGQLLDADRPTRVKPIG